MKRTYRISVTVEATFDRAINSRRHSKFLREKVQEVIDRSALPVEWVVTGSKVTSKAVSEAKPRVKLPNLEEQQRDGILASLQGHAEAMARLLGNVVKPRLRRYPSRVCWTGMTRAWAHAHITNATIYRWQKGKRAVRLGNLYGTICLSNKFLDQITESPSKVAELKRVTGVVVLPADGLDTLAHEVAHLRLPKRAHNSAKFHEMAERLEREYREVLAGTRQLPPKRAFPSRSSAGASGTELGRDGGSESRLASVQIKPAETGPNPSEDIPSLSAPFAEPVGGHPESLCQKRVPYHPPFSVISSESRAPPTTELTGAETAHSPQDGDDS